MDSDKGKISFYQGGDAIGGEDGLKSIKQKIAELSNIKNVSFLLGAGASSDSISSMKTMQEEISKGIDEGSDCEIKNLYKSIDGDNLEKKLTVLHARNNYLQGITNADATETSNTEKLIKYIEESMYSKINIDLFFEGIFTDFSAILLS